MKKIITITFYILLCIYLFNCQGPTDTNSLPTCKIISPQDNSIFVKGNIITVNVEADDKDGKIDEVRFYLDEEGVYSCSDFPYKCEINTDNIESGVHIIKAIAFDNKYDQNEDSVIILIDAPWEYNGLDKTGFIGLFSEDFDNNYNDWYVGNSNDVSVTITDGYYEIVNNSNTFIYFVWKELPSLNTNSNFEIETEIKLVDNVSGGGLFWGSDSSGDYLNYYALFIDVDKYLIIKGYNSEVEYWNLFYSDVINNNTYNKITIRKYNDEYYFFINEEWIDFHSFEPFFGNKVGFFVYPSSKIQIDYLYVYQGAEVGKTIDKININNTVKSGKIKIDKR